MVRPSTHQHHGRPQFTERAVTFELTAVVRWSNGVGATLERLHAPQQRNRCNAVCGTERVALHVHGSHEPSTVVGCPPCRVVHSRLGAKQLVMLSCYVFAKGARARLVRVGCGLVVREHQPARVRAGVHGIALRELRSCNSWLAQESWLKLQVP